MNRIGIAILFLAILLGSSCRSQSFYWSHTYVDATPTDTCYGYLYNGYVVDDIRKVTSSDDWTIPTIIEMQSLADYLGASGDYTVSNEVGKYLKEEGNERWIYATTGNNNLGFTAIGSGQRNLFTGAFAGLRNSTIIWSSTVGIVAGSWKYGYLTGAGDGFQCVDNSSEYSATGHPLRFVSDATGLADGVTTTYTGNDGKTYNAIVINQLYWTTENLEETLYRNLDPILNITDNTTWAGLATGALCLYDNNESYACKVPLPTPIEVINYGYLYNYHAIDATSTDTISNVGWHVPTETDADILFAYASGLLLAGGELKETGTTYWNSPNTGATNEHLFNKRGAGERAAGAFQGLKNLGRLATSTPASATRYIAYRFDYDDVIVVKQSGAFTAVNNDTGSSIRLIKDSTTLSDGETSTYTGNDGKIYRTICVGTQEWLADNLAETKYRNNNWIRGFDGGVYTPISNSTWLGYLTTGTGALCVYNNDENNK